MDFQPGKVGTRPSTVHSVSVGFGHLAIAILLGNLQPYSTIISGGPVLFRNLLAL